MVCGFVPCVTGPTSYPRPTQPHSTPPYPTTCTITSPRTPSNSTTITNTTPGNANKTSTIHLWLKCNACSLIHKLLITKTMSYTAQPISIIINHKLITPPAISTLRNFSLSQNRHPILAQPNFHTLYKSSQCSPKHELFSDLLVSYDR